MCDCWWPGAGSCIRLCESRFLLLEYSVEYLIEYSSTRQGKLVSKGIYIRRQKARVTRRRVRHTAYSRYPGYPTVWPGTVPESGLENGSEKNLGFFRFFKKPKNLESPKFRFFCFFYFLVKFYTNHIKFHTLIFICDLCYILQKIL